MQRNPVRILHVVGGMGRGGVETWLMHILRHIDRQRFSMDFLVHTDKPCVYDDEIRARGARIIPCLYPTPPWQYRHNFLTILKEHGPYDIVHSHVHHFSGYVLSLAQRAGVPVRIAHSHNDTTASVRNINLPRRFYRTMTERWVKRFATIGLACSIPAAEDLFGRSWQNDHRWRLLYYGIALDPFRQPVDRRTVRAELGIAPEAFVIGHVGRFAEQKNHTFLVDIAAEVIRRAQTTRLLLVGEGPLRRPMEAKARSLHLEKQLVFVGGRSDIPRLMLGAMDMFLLPSLHEGLPMVLLEAQAAGLPAVVSDVVSQEGDVLVGWGKRLSLTLPVSTWADAVLECQTWAERPFLDAPVTAVEKSRFNIQASVAELERIYTSEEARRKAA